MRPIIILLLICCRGAWAAGAVVGEPGSCMIEIGIYTAHFTIYQTDASANREFCEDLPDVGNTLFVLDYLHGSLREVPVAFRVIRDVEGWGIFSRWENVQAIEDIDARTVFYQPPSVHSGNQLTAEVLFDQPGRYIGIVSAPHSTLDKTYHAVFPFQVARFNRAPWIALGVAVLIVGVFTRRLRAGRPSAGRPSAGRPSAGERSTAVNN